MELKIKNYFLTNNQPLGIVSLQDWLAKLLLHGKVSRARTRFLKLIGERVTEIEKERMEMVKEFAEKDKDKEPIMLDEKGKPTKDDKEAKSYKVSKEGTDKFNKEFGDYLNEVLVIEVNNSNRDTVMGVKELVLDTKEEFTGIMATRYDEWATSFEDLK